MQYKVLGQQLLYKLRMMQAANCRFKEGFDEHDGDGYETPNGQCDMPYCGLNTLLARHSIVGY